MQQANPAAVGDSRTEAVLFRAADRVVEKLRPVDLLAAAIDEAEPKFLATLAQALGPDVAAADLRELIELSYPASATPGAFDGRPNRFTPEALEGIKQFDAELTAGGAASRESALHRLSPAFGALPPSAPSFPSRLPFLALDRIISNRPGLIGEVLAHETPLSRVASDHLPIVTMLSYDAV